MNIKLSKSQWEAIGKTAGWIKESAITEGDIKEHTRFYDPERHQKGELVTRKYHQTTLWMKLYESGEIEELFKGDLSRLEKI